MTETLTIELIQDAQQRGFEGTAAVVTAMEGRIAALADAAARRMVGRYRAFEDFREDFRQDAAVAMFEALPRFTGDDVDTFYGFMWGSIQDALKDSARTATNAGADSDALKVFASMMGEAGGDVYLAEKLSQTFPPKGRRLSADRAFAARIAWQGTVCIDAPVRSTDRKHEEGFEWIPSHAEAHGVPEDLISADDITSEQKRQKHALVNAILDTMSENQANALRHSYGIGGVECFGTGDSGDLPGLAAKLGLGVIPARDARVKGHKSFAKRYIKAVARSEDEAKELTDAAALNLGRGGRK